MAHPDGHVSTEAIANIPAIRYMYKVNNQPPTASVVAAALRSSTLLAVSGDGSTVHRVVPYGKSAAPAPATEAAAATTTAVAAADAAEAGGDSDSDDLASFWNKLQGADAGVGFCPSPGTSANTRASARCRTFH